MLREIYCDKFHQEQIVFNPGLSVVLGTNTGDNSIGKSTFLLIVDYVFGGSTYAGTADISRICAAAIPVWAWWSCGTGCGSGAIPAVRRACFG